MASESVPQPEQELSEIKGALDVLFTLREELATWVEEAQNEDRKEELDNVYQHVLAIESEYHRRLEAILNKSKPPV